MHKDNLGFIFDIDGCLTLPDYNYSVLDFDLLEQIFEFYNDNIPVVFVTGRSLGWLKKKYEENNKSHLLDIPTYLEFGLVFLKHGELYYHNLDHDFIQIKQEIIEKFGDEAEKSGIYFEEDKTYDDYPEHNSVWVENKFVQLSIAKGTETSTQLVYDLVQDRWKNKYPIRILYHHLGIDIIPEGWSKAKAITHYLEEFEISEANYKWYVFGDNDSDREMTTPLSKVDFYNTKHGASNKVKTVLDKLYLPLE